MLDRLSVKGSTTPRRHSDISGITKVFSDASGLIVPKTMSKSAGNSSQSLNISSNASLISHPSPASGRKTVSFNTRVQLFEHATWKKQLKRYRKIARKLAEKKAQALQEAKEKEAKGSDDSDDSSSEDEATKTAESSEPSTPSRTPKIILSPSRTPPKISIN